MAGTVSAYKWSKRYHVVTVGEESKVLVLCHPKNDGPKKRKGQADVTKMRLEDLHQPTYDERLFSDLSGISITKITVKVTPCSLVQRIVTVTSRVRCARSSQKSVHTVSRF